MTDNTWITQQGYVRKESDQTVYEASLDRIRHCFDLGDRVTVSFSGGKDSTVLLHLALTIARERDRLPLELWYFDDELVDPDTVAHIAEVAQWPEVNLQWYCVPVRHTLRSQNRTHWHTWDPDERDVWARDLPPNAITEIEGWSIDHPGNFSAAGLSQVTQHLAYITNEPDITQVVLTGIRGAESFNRTRAIMQGGSYITDKYGGYLYAKPIYDWKTTDIWKAIREHNLSYSTYYDKLRALGQVNIQTQRVGPWGNVAASREVKNYAALYPDFWERALKRMPELRAQSRYGDTNLYRETQNKPLHMTWQEYALHLLVQLPNDDRAFWVGQIKNILKRWKRHTSIPFPETTLDGGGQNSWKKLAFAIGKNDRMGGSSRDLM